MKRRRVLIGGTSVAVIGTSGCIEDFQNGGANGTADNEGEPGDDDHQRPEREEFPDPPSELTPDSAQRYVKAYEETYQHNSNITSSTVSVTPTCSTVVDHVAEDAIYVSTGCFVDHAYEDAQGHGYSFPALYRVTTEETIRIEPTEFEYNDPYGLWLSNFSDQHHDLSLQLVHTDSDQTTILDETVDLPPENGVYVSSVPSTSGEYELVAELGSGVETSESIVLPEDNEHSPYLINPLYAVHITPDGSVTAREIYFEEP